MQCKRLRPLQDKLGT